MGDKKQFAEALEYAKLIYEGRVAQESLSSDYCGSCSFEAHVSQMAESDSWIHSSVDIWRNIALTIRKVGQKRCEHKRPVWGECYQCLEAKHGALMTAGGALYDNLMVTGLDAWAAEEDGKLRSAGQGRVSAALKGWRLASTD